MERSEQLKKYCQPQDIPKFLPLFEEIDKHLSQGKLILAVEGGIASGKTTLGKML